MNKLMGRFVSLLLICCALVSVSMAEEKRVMLSDFSFALPEMLVEQLLTDEASKAGVVYAAENEDASLRFVLMCQKLRRGGDTSASALVARQVASESVTVEDPITVDGYEFVLSTEVLEEAGKSVIFRLATSVVEGNKLTFFFIDRIGEYAETSQRLVNSFLLKKQEEIKL